MAMMTNAARVTAIAIAIVGCIVRNTEIRTMLTTSAYGETNISATIIASGIIKDIKRASGAGETRVPQRPSPPLWAITSGSPTR